MDRILCIRPDKAGDALKSLPSLRALTHSGKYQVHLWTSSHNHSLYEFEAGLEAFSLPPQWEQLNQEGLELWISSHVLAPYDVVINLPLEVTPANQALLDFIPAKAKFTARDVGLVEPHIAGIPEQVHCTQLISRALGIDALETNDYEVPVLTERDREEATKSMGEKKQHWLGVCPLAGGSDRSHTLVRWQRFLKTLCQNKNQSVFIFGAPSDIPALEKVAGSQRVSLVTPSSFRTLGAYLSRLDAVVGVDSGPLHYARILDIPSLTLMSGGDQARWFPDKGPTHHVLRRGRFDRFPFTWEMKRALRNWQTKASQPPHQT